MFNHAKTVTVAKTLDRSFDNATVADKARKTHNVLVRERAGHSRIVDDSAISNVNAVMVKPRPWGKQVRTDWRFRNLGFVYRMAHIFNI